MDALPPITLLHHFLQKVSFNNSAAEQISFGPHGELETGFDIFNWVTFPNKSFVKVQIGKTDPLVPPEKLLTISAKEAVWPLTFNQTLPRSICNKECLLGHSKVKLEGKLSCCYDCKLCPEGKIADQLGKQRNTGSPRVLTTIDLKTFVAKRDICELLLSQLLSESLQWLS
uniref:GPCR family 3 nine cysteines domain-containing protein n=2 Tax=Micrurus corallinus TaxID=54390 RepID=A0A2D4FXM1_MICCO